MIFSTLFLIVFIYFAYDYWKLLNYWKNRNVKYITPLPFLGNVAKLVFQIHNFNDITQEFYKQYPNERIRVRHIHSFYKGNFLPNFGHKFPPWKEFLCLYHYRIRTLELIKKITIKDFDSFLNHHILFKEDVDPLWGKNLFASQGERWRELRQTISPVFTSSKMRTMFKLMEEVSIKYVEHVKNQNLHIMEFEAADLFSKFTVDVIATTAFGLENNSLENHEFLRNGRDLTNFSGFKKIRMILAGIHPWILKTLGIRIIDKQAGNYFKKIIVDAIDYREKHGIIRPDLINSLMEVKRGNLKFEQENEKNESFAQTKEYNGGNKKTFKTIDIDKDDITAQAMIFFMAGYHNVQILKVFMCYELLINPDIQDKLRNEMLDLKKKNNGKVTYEDLLALKYLDMVISETLRLWPLAPFIDRQCNKDYTIEPEKPSESPLIIEKGVNIMIPIGGFHLDPKYWPNPLKFDPERFSDENKHTIQVNTFMPFGIGPRNCVGSRFALVDTKVVFYHLLTNFEIIKTEKTVVPAVLSKTEMNTTIEGGLYFGLKKLK